MTATTFHPAEKTVRPGKRVFAALFAPLAAGFLASAWGQPPSPWTPGLIRVSETEVIFALEAPGKGTAKVVGDFNHWNPATHPMTKDGDRFWARVSGLTPGKEYIYQYWIDENVKIGDPYGEKIVDFHSDPEIIREGVYPGLIPFSREFDGLASVFRAGTAAPAIRKPFVKPDPENLILYETLIRDFTRSHSFAELRDSLPYFKRLGINAIELMPVMEFENNGGWGYNPSYPFAVDKYYGPAEELKKLIEAAHAQGIAVILDIVLNHAMGQHPLIRMYWDQGANRPAAGSPFANPTPRHDYNVGFDLNYESDFTRAYYKRVLQYWLREFQVDGYRIDLSKGLTQKNTLGDITAWSRLDPTRVAILEDLARAAREVDPDAYLILEHFGDNEEEKLLAGKGFLLWGNSAFDHGHAIAGNTAMDFDWAYSGIRTWATRSLVSYMESHDEERLVHRAKVNGLSSGGYDTRNLETALERAKMTALFLFGIPGPKMMWQFGEWGDDRVHGTTATERMGPKPMPAEWRLDPARQKLWNAYAGLLHFRRDHAGAFKAGTFAWKPAGAVRTWDLRHGSVKAFAVGNFGVTQDRLTFAQAGTWYDYFTREKFTLTGAVEVPLKPGEWHLWVDRPVFAAVPEVSAFPVPAVLNPERVTVGVRPALGNPSRPKSALGRNPGTGLTVLDARGNRKTLTGRRP